ncbi:PAS domain S-box protein [Anoxynatronum buryatiense]|uniref:Circadian input-output histidine kinase CikA n=1 Tax=Anoxynatronum buryatiense TaxID=489973 RepID=A0AA45WVM4_9CLOT|nr:PAS domain S-box protein [Anoxynatronum buryatiense]SMP54594.1 PAS domain S-box-containing protein [Anoxynatronum buryatiense]
MKTTNMTERMEQKEQLKLFQKIVNGLDYPFYVIDANNYQVIMANEAALAGREHLPEKITCHQLTHGTDIPCDPKEHPCALLAVMNSKKAVVMEHVHYDYQGNPVDVEVHAHPLYNEAGEIDQVVEYSLDISDRKEMERLLAESEEIARKLTAAMDQTASMVVITDKEGCIEYVNAAFSRTTGYTLKEVMGKNPRILKSDDKSSEEYRKLWETITAGQDWRGRFCNRKKEGGLYWEEANISPIFNTAGEITHFIAVKEDITEQRKTEEALRKSEALLRASQAITRTGAWEWDVEKQTMYWTDQTYRLHGMEPGEVAVGLPEHIDQSLTGYNRDDIPRISAAFKACLEDGKPYDMELPYTTRKGDKIWIRTSAEPVIEKGRVTRVIGTFMDITQRKSVEEELKKARDEAQKANEAKSRYLANMSHEIRNPMNAVIGMTHLALQTQLTPQQAAYLNRIDQSAKALLELINDVLDLSKIEAGKMELESAPVDMEALVEQVKAVVETLAREKSLAIQFHMAPDVPRTVKGDAVRLSQVLINLMSNGVKFTETGSVSLSVRTGGSLKSGEEKLVFIVEDTGIGMTPLQMKHLFDPFRQGETSTTRRFGGTGLGLSICRHLADLMGGELLVKSEPGQGSTFQFSVTLPLDTASETSNEAVGMTTPEEMPESLEELRVLVVEDQEVNQMVARGILENWGIAVSVASNGYEALEMIKTDSYDLVLMDIRMPGMSGLTAVRRIRQHDQWRDLPVIAMTAEAMSGNREESLAAGMNDHVPKPIDPEQLYHTLLRWGLKKQGDITGATAEETTPVADAMQVTDLLPESLPGIDVAEGLERFLGDREVFIQILEHVYEHRCQELNALRQAITEENFTNVRFLTHRIKGMAGNISAYRLHETAQEMEKLLADQQHTHLPAAFREMEEAMIEVTEGLEPLVKRNKRNQERWNDTDNL